MRNDAGAPIAGARVDIWQTANNGFYPMQDPSQDPMNMRGVFTDRRRGPVRLHHDASGRLLGAHRRPRRRLLDASGRHPMRAAHTHFIVSAPGYYPVTTHFFDSESPYLESDAVFGVRDSLILDLESQPDGTLATTFDIALTPVEEE